MNKLLTNLAQAKNNPHVFWPILIAIALRVGLQIVFGALNIYHPTMTAQNKAFEDLLEPYFKDALQFLSGYATIAAATTSPAQQSKIDGQQTPK